MNVAIIQNKIYEVRGQKIMLDSDLAEFYQTETKYLKRAVRQNTKRFPVDFMFELTKEEYDSLRCNFSTLNSKQTLKPRPAAETVNVKADGLQTNNRGKHR